MPQAPTPLTLEQQRLVNLVRVAHDNLILARRLKVQERTRRVAIARADFERVCAQIELDIENEIVQHEVAEDAAIIAAYNNGVPVLRIGTDGFGNRLPGAAQRKVAELREAGLLGNKVDYQAGQERVEFPKAVDVEATLTEALTVEPPKFEANDLPLVLLPATDTEPGVSVPSVKITMDPRDPWFKQIEQNARPGTEYRHATTATIYLAPHDGSLVTYESKEAGDTYWDHPVARWVKDHPTEALEGYETAIFAAA